MQLKDLVLKKFEGAVGRCDGVLQRDDNGNMRYYVTLDEPHNKNVLVSQKNVIFLDSQASPPAA